MGLGFLLAWGIAPAQQGGRGDQQTRVVPAISGGSTADSNGSMIAVTGVDVTGQSVLYLVDTERYQLAVYQASGGSSGTQGVKLVGARRIDLDLQIPGFNDRTEEQGKPLRYSDLRSRFQADGLLDAKGKDE